MMHLSRASGQRGQETAICSGYASQGDTPIVVNGHKVIDESDFFTMESSKKYFNIAIADYKARERISKKMIDSNIQPFTIMA